MKFIRGTGDRERTPASERRKEDFAVRKAIGSLVLSVFLFTIGYAQTLIYSWRDRAGTVHIVDDLRNVPLSYREDMRVYRIPSTGRAKEPAPRTSSRAVTRAKEGQEGALEGDRSGKEIARVRASITELTERLDRLKQERETKRIRIIRKRARGDPVYRETKELERIDEEIELLTDQLGNKMEALGSLEREKSRAGAQ
jgi:hypothetical protein